MATKVILLIGPSSMPHWSQGCLKFCGWNPGKGSKKCLEEWALSISESDGTNMGLQ